MKEEENTKKKIGQLIDCPCCDGSGVQKIYTFGELQEIHSHKDGQVRTTFILGGRKFKVFMKIEEVPIEESGCQRVEGDCENG